MPVERATRFDQATNDIYTVQLSMLKASSLSSLLSAQGFKGGVWLFQRRLRKERTRV